MFCSAFSTTKTGAVPFVQLSRLVDLLGRQEAGGFSRGDLGTSLGSYTNGKSLLLDERTCYRTFVRHLKLSKVRVRANTKKTK